MASILLTRFTVPGPIEMPALRQYLRVARRLAARPACTGWQTYRGIERTEAVFAVSHWTDAPPDPAVELAAEVPCGVTAIATLLPEFEASFHTEPTPAGLVRVAYAPAMRREERAARDRDFALRTMAAPGSIRVRLARGEEQSLFVVDFDSDDALWAFLDSPLRRAWSLAGAQGGEEEIWAITLPRLDFGRPRPISESLAIPAQRSEDRFGPLTIVLEEDEQRRAASVRAQGLLDLQGVPRLERVCRALAEGGCRSLVLDISQLRVAPEALTGLLRIARELRSALGRLDLVDNDQRFRQVTRMAFLQRAITEPVAPIPSTPGASRRRTRRRRS